MIIWPIASLDCMPDMAYFKLWKPRIAGQILIDPKSVIGFKVSNTFQTLNPTSHTPHSTPHTPHHTPPPTHRTPNSRPQTHNPKLHNPQPSKPKSVPHTLNQTPNPRPQTPNPGAQVPLAPPRVVRARGNHRIGTTHTRRPQPFTSNP
jgi:hypothetical protein